MLHQWQRGGYHCLLVLSGSPGFFRKHSDEGRSPSKPFRHSPSQRYPVKAR